MTGLEALVRWQHPERGLMLPAEFVPLAEETGLIVPIGSRVLERALRAVCRTGVHDPQLTVVGQRVGSPARGPAPVSTCPGALAATGVDPRRCSSRSTRRGDAISTLVAGVHGLSELGVRIAIDDFGTGSSSLDDLKRLPIDAMKLTRAAWSPGSGVTPAMMPSSARSSSWRHTFGVDVIAEGVETEAQLRRLRELRCDGAQGYMFGRPAPAHEVQALLIAAGDAVHQTTVP